jgi:hypothetical protein
MEKWKNLAKIAGLSVSEWVRRRCNDGDRSVLEKGRLGGENHEEQKVTVPAVIGERSGSGDGIPTAVKSEKAGKGTKKIEKAAEACPKCGLMFCKHRL